MGKAQGRWRCVEEINTPGSSGRCRAWGGSELDANLTLWQSCGTVADVPG